MRPEPVKPIINKYVRNTQSEVGTLSQSEKGSLILQESMTPTRNIEEADVADAPPITQKEAAPVTSLGRIPDIIEEQQNKNLNKFAGIKFIDEIKIDFIRSIDYRILCRFLGVTSVNDLKNYPYGRTPLITLLLMQSLSSYMKVKGYVSVGELNFDREGNSIPPEKTVWKLNSKELSFTTTGFVYFEKEKNKKKNSNVVYFLYLSAADGTAIITCYTRDEKKSEKMIKGLKDYAKNNNALRGAKLRDINMYSASFTEVETPAKYTWDNYYYPQNVIDLFNLEVFGFLKNTKLYNKEGIVKRGVIIHGRPGCVLKDTKIKIRKKRKEGKHKVINE